MQHANRLIDEGCCRFSDSVWSRCGNGPEGAHQLPAFQSFDFDSIRDLLENILICDVNASKQPTEFVVRSHGKVIGDLYGADCSGRTIDAIAPNWLNAREDYIEAARQMVPTFRRTAISDYVGEPVSFERLLLPFTVSGQSTDRIISAVYLFAEGNGFDRRRLLTER